MDRRIGFLTAQHQAWYFRRLPVALSQQLINAGPAADSATRFQRRAAAGGAPPPKTVSATTRTEPVAFQGGRKRTVRTYPELVAA